MKIITNIFFAVLLFTATIITAQVTLEREVKISDFAMYFNGDRVPISHTANSTTGYDFVYGRTLTPHGDCIKTYKNYVFMSWYRGGKEDRHVMLTRYNMDTGSMQTIEFPHQHTGYRGRWWIGETHNTIAIAISPINGTVHMVYDMHAYTNGGFSANDYFRYSYSVENAADLPDEEFTLDKFVKDPIDGDYKHTTMDGKRNAQKYDRFTYPQFFQNKEGELFLTARDGTSHDGAQAFIKYDASENKWGNFYYFNALGARSKGETHNWSIYGSMKYVGGKIRIGYQRRLNTGSDKYNAQNGVYYAYSDDPTGASEWKNHKGEPITSPIVKAEESLIFEPGDSVATNQRNMVHIVSGFDWTVTDNGDVHIISKVQDRENSVTKNFHSFKPGNFEDSDDFITTSNFAGASNIYTSGNDVFVIGLNSSGRPFVDRTAGGTNAFIRVYEQTSGKRFTKGQVHISNGKLYYYLLESKPNNNEDVRTTYLQIIDLSFFSKPSELGVTILTPSDNQSFNEGGNIELIANATADEGKRISKIEFLVDGNVLFEDTTAPYKQNWLPTSIGSYTLQAIAYQEDGKTIVSDEILIEVKEIDFSDITLDTYRLQNLATGKFLKAAATATGVLLSDTANELNTHWEFFKVEKNGKEYHNIDSKENGVLRATGSGFQAGAFLVVSTGKAPSVTDSDKIWTVHRNEATDNFRFEAGSSGRYMYLDQDGNVYSKDVPETDERGLWRLVPSNQVLSVFDNFSENSSINIYPNPAKNSFTIALNNIGESKVSIVDILGKTILETTTTLESLEVLRDKRFTSGVYIVKVTSKISQNKPFYKKLILE